MRLIRATIVVVEKLQSLHILIVCVSNHRYPACLPLRHTFNSVLSGCKIFFFVLRASVDLVTNVSKVEGDCLRNKYRQN